MEQTLNSKRLLTTIGIVILTASVVGGTTWYVMKEQANSQERHLWDTIHELRANQETENIIDKAENQSEVCPTRDSLLVACQDVANKLSNTTNATSITIKNFSGNYGYCTWGMIDGSPGMGGIFMRFLGDTWNLEFEGQGYPAETLKGLGFPSEWFYPFN